MEYELKDIVRAAGWPGTDADLDTATFRLHAPETVKWLLRTPDRKPTLSDGTPHRIVVNVPGKGQTELRWLHQGGHKYQIEWADTTSVDPS